MGAEANGTVQTVGECAVGGRQQLPNHKNGFSFAFLAAPRLPASNFVNPPGGITGAHFRTFGESALKASKKEEDDGVTEEEGARSSKRAINEKDGGVRKPVWRPNEWREERRLRLGLLRNLRVWPPDEDLDKKLPNATIGGKLISAGSLRATLYSLAKGPIADPTWDKSTALYKEAKQEAVQAVRGSKFLCSEEDALRALNALEWWLSRNPKDPSKCVDMLFSPVLHALAAARRTDAISRLWDRHCYRGEGNDRFVPVFLAACLLANMFGQLLTMYKQAEENGWRMSVETVNIVIKAMAAQGCSCSEIWEFHKSWFEKTGMRPQWPTLVTLLTSGVTVEEIQSLHCEDSLFDAYVLIRALAELGRANEAQKIVRHILGSQDCTRPMPIIAVISLLRLFIQSGFQAEAERLADQQERLGLRLGAAMYFYLKTVKKSGKALETYQTLEAIEGSHRQSLAVLAVLIRRCYEDLHLTKAMYHAYLVGRGLEGEFTPPVFADLVERLAQKDRAAEAEGVLADYFQARHKLRSGNYLAERAFEELAAMYLKFQQPQKLVGLVRNMLTQRYFVSNTLLMSWVRQLKAGDHRAEAEEMLVAESEMAHLRREWTKINRNVDRRGEKKDQKRGSEVGVDIEESEGTSKEEGRGGADALVAERRLHEDGQ